MGRRSGAARRETSRLRLLPSLIILALLPAPCGPVAGFVPLAGDDGPGSPPDVLGAIETRVAPRDFRLSGTIATPLVPGARRALDVVIENLDPYPLEVSSISVSFAGPVLRAGGSQNPACRVDGPSPDLVVERNFVGPVIVPPNGTLSLSALAVPEDRWPLVAMIDRPVNQDGCRNSVFPLVLTGTGRVE